MNVNESEYRYGMTGLLAGSAVTLAIVEQFATGLSGTVRIVLTGVMLGVYAALIFGLMSLDCLCGGVAKCVVRLLGWLFVRFRFALPRSLPQTRVRAANCCELFMMLANGINQSCSHCQRQQQQQQQRHVTTIAASYR